MRMRIRLCIHDYSCNMPHALMDTHWNSESPPLGSHLINPWHACAGGVLTVVCLYVCVCVCVCLSVRTLGGHSFVYGFKVRYQRLVHDVLRVFHSWISLEVFRSRVRASFV